MSKSPSLRADCRGSPCAIPANSVNVAKSDDSLAERVACRRVLIDVHGVNVRCLREVWMEGKSEEAGLSEIRYFLKYGKGFRNDFAILQNTNSAVEKLGEE